MEDFIELNRTFRQLSSDNNDDPQNDDFDLVGALNHSFNKHLNWEELLKEPRVILLAEAGAGKTQEIRYAANKSRSEGRAAFFLRLEHIVDDLESSFEVGDYHEFQGWLKSNEEGWLLLDSVDEARLRDPKDFERAVRKLSNRVSPAIQRVHLIITSRVTAWRPMTDLRLCNERFPFIEPQRTIQVVASDGVEDEKGEEVFLGSLDGSAVKHTAGATKAVNVGFKVYSLNDLDKEQIKVFVKAKGVRDDERFLEEIQRQDAWAFTTRPQDLDEILGYWTENKKIGTRYDLMRHSIERRIKERDQDRAYSYPLSLEKAGKGVQLLSTACTFMNESVIKVPDNRNGTESHSGIDATSILHDWDERECQTLLSRPIFDEAIYGSVRFHHRSVREYFAAEWLSEKLNEAGSRQKIESLFFRK